MRFGDPELDEMLRDHFRPAVQRTGFTLFRLDDEPRAGLIDDRLRVEIRQSRFLLSDLTHANNGAYWEAGYAEGLGKPVIYLCKKEVFENPKTRPHFDTNHHLTIVWDRETIQEDMERLVATIRYSIPEARQVDAS
jgi:nucleoside 2-deoxyribosyltransferase